MKPHEITLTRRGVEVRIVDHTPVTPCPCSDCGELIEPEDCAKGWGAAQLCATCHDKYGLRSDTLITRAKDPKTSEPDRQAIRSVLIGRGVDPETGQDPFTGLG